MDLGKLSELAKHRMCQQCGAEFEVRIEEGREVSTLEQFSDHLRTHQPTQAQWTEAYNKIQAGKERAKHLG